MKKWWWPPWMDSQDCGIHSFKECVPEGSDYFKKRREDGSKWRSSSHLPKKIPQAMRNMKNSTLEEPLIHLSIWIRNNAIMNEEDDEAKGWRMNLHKTNKDKYSIVISSYFFMHLFIFSWCIMHDRMFALMTVYYYYACDG